jgi:hypothetical protein
VVGAVDLLSVLATLELFSDVRHSHLELYIMFDKFISIFTLTL